MNIALAVRVFVGVLAILAAESVTGHARIKIYSRPLAHILISI